MQEKYLSKKFIFIYCFINYIPIIINYLWIIILKEYKSEFEYSDIKVEVNFLIISFVLLLIISTLCILLRYNHDLQNHKFVIDKRLSLDIVRGKIEIYLIILLFLNYYNFLISGVGKAGGVYSRSFLSTLMFFLNFKFFFWIYFFKYVKQRNFKFYIIILAYMILQFIQGWTYFVLEFFLAFLCTMESKKQNKFLLLLPVLFIVGSLFYYFMYPIKFFIRTGNFVSISFADAVIKLFQRLSSFSFTIASIQNSDKIMDLYYKFNTNGTELISFFYPWVPGFLLPVKSQRVLNNLHMLAVYPNYSVETSAGLGISYFYFLGKLGIVYLIFYFSIYFFLIYVYKFMIDLLIPENVGYKYYLLFTMVLYPLRGISFRQMGTDVPAIWTLILLILLGIIKIRKKRIV